MGDRADAALTVTDRLLPSDDKSTNPRVRLRTARAWLFDMDGVLYRGSDPLPGVAELLDALELRERSYMLATNNSTATPAEYVKKLHAMGIVVPASAILTSAIATREYLQSQFDPGSRFYVIGMPSLSQQLFADGTFVPAFDSDPVPAGVVIGLDKFFTYDKLRIAHAAIKGGAKFIATNTDATLPTESGLVPGAGSLIAALATAAGFQPLVIGKPEPTMLLMALHKLGIAPSEAVMVGDRLDTDIVAGKRAGMLTVMVLTGVSTREEIAFAEAMPDLVFTDLTAVLDALSADE